MLIAHNVILAGNRRQMRNNRDVQQACFAALQRHLDFVFGGDKAHAVALAIFARQLHTHIDLNRLVADVL